MLKIGITGGIGSGKTTICKLFELQKVPVFYADVEAKRAMSTDRTLIDQLKSAFGNDIYSPQGVLNRSKLASVVFNNQQELEKLHSLVHPAVFRLFDNWLEHQTAPYILKEAALLFESNSYQQCDYTLLVKSPLALKIARVMQRDTISEADILKRMSKQFSDEEKEKLSDFTILNTEHELIIPQVLALHARFLTEA